MEKLSLSNLKYNYGSIKRRKRVGRGPSSGKGGTCCRGNNGGKQRSGFSNKLGFEGGQTPFSKRLPMIHRINKFRDDKPKTVTLDMLKKVISANVKEIGFAILSKFRIINDGDKYKIVCGKKNEDLDGLKISANGFSEKAKILIEKAGGECILISG